jgi:hypothetical protein
MKRAFALLSCVVGLADSNVVVMWSPVEGESTYSIYCRSIPPLSETAFNAALTNPYFDVSEVFAGKPYGMYEMTVSCAGEAIYMNLWVPWFPPEATPKAPEGVKLDMIN